MPLFKTIEVNSQTIVKIWYISEPLEVLLTQVELTNDSQSRLKSMKNEWHQREFLSVRLLLNSLGYADDDVKYDSKGKPMLMDGNFISITHSKAYAAVAVSANAVCVDLEQYNDKLITIKSKFVGYESCYLNQKAEDYLKQLTQIWCTKEALYKLYSKAGISFKNQFLVIPFGNQNTSLSWVLDGAFRGCYTAHCVEIEDYSCIITTPKL